MSQPIFPTLPLDKWRATRDTLHTYSRVLGKIRQAMAPRHKHWQHVSLRTAAAGLTTTPIPAGSMTFEMLLDFTAHSLLITTSQGERLQMALRGQSAADFCQTTLEALDTLDIRPQIDQALFENNTPGVYDTAVVGHFWQALSQLDITLKQFRGELRGETGPVQFWPHHFDLALLWFSGRKVPGQDPENEEYADEQMNFGFSTGDESIPDAYFYATAYPWPETLSNATLPDGATWHTEGWKGALLMYDTVAAAENPREMLLAYLRASHQAGAHLMAKE